MAEKHIVVQGAICKCQYGQAPDTLKVLSHDKEYANDKDASKKRIATTKEIGGATLEKNTFGNCMKIGGNPPPPCKPVITEWKDFYNKVTLSNGGNILLEDSKAVCAIAGTPCIEIIDHGQRTEASAQNFKNTNKEIQRQINPLVTPEEMYEKHQMNGEENGEIVECYLTTEEGEILEEALPNMFVYLHLKTKNMIGKTINIDLSNSRIDFLYKNNPLKSDILEEFPITKNEEVIKDLKTIKQK